LVFVTNIDITGGLISTTGLQNELTGGTNISIVGDVVSCDLTGSTNIDITGGVISTTGLATTTQLETNEENITTLQQNNVIYNSNEYGLKAVSNFISRTSISGNWKKVIYAPELNLFVAIGDDTSNKSIMTSTNGIYWNYPESSPTRALNDIVWSPELLRFVAVSANSDNTTTAIYTSDDAITWTERTTVFFTDTITIPGTTTTASADIYIIKLNCITWSPELNLFVSIDRRGYIITSSNGINWTYRARPNGNVVGTSVCWSPELNIFVAVFESGSHRVMVSSNGITWQSIEVSFNSWGDVVWSPQLGLFVTVADSGTGNRVMTSPDGTTWTDGSISDFSWDGIVWSDLGYFLAIARDGYIAYSNDGFNWIESVLSGIIREGCWSKELGIFVVVGNDTIYTSSLKNRKPTNDNIFDNEYNTIDENGIWNFNSLTTNSLTLPTIGDVEDAIQGKEPTIQDNGLTIAKTAGLQDALDSKFNNTGGSITGSVDITGNLVVGTTNIIEEIGTKQDSIQVGDLTITQTAG